MTGQQLTEAYRPISDYGLIGDTHSCALISKEGSVDWACFPRFDSRAVFARLLDSEKGGHFTVRPRGEFESSRRYLPATNILETTFRTPSGVIVLTDFMPVHGHSKPAHPQEIFQYQQIARILICTSGSVDIEVVCQPRFDYGSIVPHAQMFEQNSGYAHGGADAIAFHSSIPLEVVDHSFYCEGSLQAGERAYFTATYTFPTGHDLGSLSLDDPQPRLEETQRFWVKWSEQFSYDGPYKEDVLRSALTLKALTYAPTGGLVAAPTCSLPETVGGERNWDYRFTWIRDAVFALYALNIVGFSGEAHSFKGWLERATVGRAQDLQVMYGLAGERRLTEEDLDHLQGYRGSQPVRIGNAAHQQLQLDIYGEVLDSAHLYRRFVGQLDPEYWEFCQEVVQYAVEHWREPDEGIWETRGGRRHFVFSKVMCWVALDRAIKAVEAVDFPGPVEMWRKVREEIRQDILEKGYSPDMGAFVQSYGSKALDASVLMLPLVGFIKATDPHMRSTIEMIAAELTSPQGLVYRYKAFDDGLQGSEGTFSLCTFWLADNFILLGEIDRASDLLERLRGYANELGLFSEQIDAETGEMLGNFPQAFTHMALINTVVQLHKALSRQSGSPQKTV